MRKTLLHLCLILPIGLSAQQVSLTDMSFWKNSGKTNWSIVQKVQADLNTEEAITTQPGTGVLVNQPEKGNNANLESKLEHGDADFSFDFMMAKGSNSGFYLQGRYEVQLLDSWGVKEPHTGDCGGIYKRRRFIKDETGKMQEYLWEGHAPRINTCLAPGLWQHMDIQFRAPKFDASGNKIANAKVLQIKMNGIIIQENVELTGPTGGPISEKEVPLGPIMIQGDHGKVAFRNMAISNLSGKPAELKDIDYQVFIGAFKEPKDFLTKKPNLTGKLDKLTWEVTKQPNDFAAIYKANLIVPEAGKHELTFQIGGKYYVNIGGKEVLPDEWTFTNDKRNVMVDLASGSTPIDITVYKTDGWMQPIMAMWVAGPNFRAVPLHSIGSVLAGSPSDPILLDAKTPTILRSFSDLYKDGKKLKRVTHAVNVGNPDKLHYTYDLDNGTIAQIWKGDFLNTSPMWDDRGDGSSRPRGNILTLETANKGYFGPISPQDKSGSIMLNFKTLGYDLDENDLPTFRYQVYGTEVNDKIRITDGKYFTRTISVKNTSENSLFRYELAEGISISKVNENTFLVDEAYYIKAEKAEINDVAGKMKLSTAFAKAFSYSIIW